MTLTDLFIHLENLNKAMVLFEDENELQRPLSIYVNDEKAGDFFTFKECWEHFNKNWSKQFNEQLFNSEVLKQEREIFVFSIETYHPMSGGNKVITLKYKINVFF